MEKIFMSLLKNMGFDAEAVQAKVYEAVQDIHAMKESQDRCEEMLKQIMIVRARTFGEVVKAVAETRPTRQGMNIGGCSVEMAADIISKGQE